MCGLLFLLVPLIIISGTAVASGVGVQDNGGLRWCLALTAAVKGVLERPKEVVRICAFDESWL